VRQARGRPPPQWHQRGAIRGPPSNQSLKRPGGQRRFVTRWCRRRSGVVSPPPLSSGVDMTSAVKSGLPMFPHGLRPLVFRPAAEAEPVRDDGGSCGSPWIGDHLPGGRQVPAALSARGFVAAASRRRGVHHTGAAPLPMDDQSRVPTAAGRSMGARDGVSETSWAMAHRHARHARAMATTPGLACFPLALSCRERWHRRIWAFHRLSWRGLDTCSRRRCRGRLTLAGSREAQAPSTRARRAWLWPVLGMPPCRRCAPVESSEGVQLREFISGLG
jgi:hypothetical protein